MKKYLFRDKLYNQVSAMITCSSNIGPVLHAHLFYSHQVVSYEDAE